MDKVKAFSFSHEDDSNKIETIINEYLEVFSLNNVTLLDIQYVATHNRLMVFVWSKVKQLPNVDK